MHLLRIPFEHFSQRFDRPLVAQLSQGPGNVGDPAAIAVENRLDQRLDRRRIADLAQSFRGQIRLVRIIGVSQLRNETLNRALLFRLAQLGKVVIVQIPTLELGQRRRDRRQLAFTRAVFATTSTCGGSASAPT